MRLAAQIGSDDASKVSTIETLEDQKTQELLNVLTPEQRQRFAGFTQLRERLVKKEAQTTK